MDRERWGIERSVAFDGGINPLGRLTAPANRHDSLLLGENLGRVEAVALCSMGRGGIWTAASTRLYQRVASEARHGGGISGKGKPATLASTR